MYLRPSSYLNKIIQNDFREILSSKNCTIFNALYEEIQVLTHHIVKADCDQDICTF